VSTVYGKRFPGSADGPRMPLEMIGRRSTLPARVALVGLHGHGRWHLGNVRRLVDSGVVELAGVCDPQPPTADMAELIGGIPWSADLGALLDSAAPDITILCTPINTHVDLGLQVAAAGSHLLLEKPPAPSLAEFGRLTDGLDRIGTKCQVGFQNLGSGAVAGMRALIDDGALGELRGIGVAGLSVRDASYFGRAGWAGRRRLGGADVVDGVLTNAYAHAVAAALRVADAEAPGRIVATELELHRANEIESDDTSVARLATSSGITIVVAATLCATEPAEPVLTVHGTRGTATWRYKRDAVRVDVEGDCRELSFDRTDLLVDLVDHLGGTTESLLVSLASTRAITEFVDTVRRAPEPAPIAPEHRLGEGSGAARRWIVNGVDAAVRQAADDLTVFSEQGVPWAVPPAEDTVATLVVGESEVARYETAPTLEPKLSPRPFLDPVRTLGGTIVSARKPADHQWHLGVGVAIQDVAGVNFWGGRTYVGDEGYVWRDDHGTIRHLGWTGKTSRSLDHDLAWMSPDHRCLLVEQRSICAAAVDGKPDRWILEFRFALRNVSGREVSLGSPGSHGRSGGGYGGFFWRLPRSAAGSEVCTDRAIGEERVHGSVAPWIAWTGRDSDGDGAFTLVIAPGDEAAAADPWFVRMADYPGLGSALAWDHPVTLGPADNTTRCLRALVVDGADHDPAALYEDLCRASTSIGAS
jgi:predicted dehydrogenase